MVGGAEWVGMRSMGMQGGIWYGSAGRGGDGVGWEVREIVWAGLGRGEKGLLGWDVGVMGRDWRGCPGPGWVMCGG